MENKWLRLLDATSPTLDEKLPISCFGGDAKDIQKLGSTVSGIDHAKCV